MSIEAFNRFDYKADPFYQFINENYSNDPGYTQISKILESGFNQEKINYLLLVELIRSINELNYTLESFKGRVL